ncbi:putative malate:quinone oxidoreductase 2 [Jeotgalicoccus meleagridis]|uniref:Probable malate:quinone oxidoreductase n=2 Tax=Jeotgalicoccus meleagridis TaxID=2759181 RepID=A0A6V7R239_9STAP|nr:putative malate:quinone oxidoreductase 2 [Jeotgalicoccus meleagridis]
MKEGSPMSESKDIILIGAGIMSATLGTFIKKLEPSWNIKMFERLDQPALESSNETNNAGTGHAALCELNYTVEQEDGSIDFEKAKVINEQFEISKQFWSYLVKNEVLEEPSSFIKPLPHISFVEGSKNVNFLKKRYEALKDLAMFEGLKYSENHEEIKNWIPLMMNGRSENETLAASKVDYGTDVNFGALTRQLVSNLSSLNRTSVHFNHEVKGFRRLDDGRWEVQVQNDRGSLEFHTADYVFIGAGGHAIPLLQKTGIKESKHIGGFPISGAFLVCNNPVIVNAHQAKVYGKEPEGKPPMTVPHLDRRYLNGQESLLFGPFAAIGPKLLKYGSNTDLFKSVNSSNLMTMLIAGAKNLPLIQYSIEQVLMKKKDRMTELRRFVPDAKDEDWDLHIAGKRVQVIKDSQADGRGYIQFGTEVINSEDHSIMALLGESPGASVSVAVALEIIEKNFPGYIEEWKEQLVEMIPSYGQSLIDDDELMRGIRKESKAILGL